MSQSYNESRRRLFLIAGAMSIAALATAVGMIHGYDSYWSIVALLCFLLVAGGSLFQLYRRE
jgi:hypothetical protein